MKKAYILHGVRDFEEFSSREYPSSSNSHWLPWLQKELVIAGYFCQTPEMPKPYAPKYEEWKELLGRFSIDKQTTIIGHSAGAGFAMRYLLETGVKIDKLILVAPWIDPAKKHADFLQFNLDASLITQANEIYLLHSTDDFDQVCETVATIRTAYPTIPYHEFQNYGHFCRDDMGTEAFPELLDLIL